MATEPPTAYVDLTVYGKATKFTALDGEVKDKVHPGDLVWVTDYEVEPRLFRITEFLARGRVARYEIWEDVRRSGAHCKHGKDSNDRR